MIRIKNTSKVEQVIALQPAEGTGVSITARVRVDGVGVKKINRVVGDSIRLQPGELSRELADVIANDPNVDVLVRRGIVKIEKI